MTTPASDLFREVCKEATDLGLSEPVIVPHHFDNRLCLIHINGQRIAGANMDLCLDSVKWNAWLTNVSKL